MRANGWIIVLVVGGLVLSVLGSALAWRQVAWRSGFVQTPARITQTGVSYSRLGGYRPAITYQYDLGGEEYTSRRYAPLPVFGTIGWARRLEQRYPTDQQVTAWVDRRQPARAYLQQTSLFYPHGLILVGLTMFGAAALLGRKRAVGLRPAQAASSHTSGWFALGPRSAPLAEAGFTLLTALAYLGLSGLVIGHYWNALGPSYDRLAWLSLAVFAAGLVGLTTAIRRVHAASPFADVSVETALSRAHLDAPIVARVTVPVRSAVYVQQVRLRLVCLRCQGGRTARIFASGQNLAEDRTLEAGETLVGDLGFEVPRNKRRPSQQAGGDGEVKSGDADSRTDIRWRFELQVRRPRAADLTIVFPFEAHARAQTETQESAKAESSPTSPRPRMAA